MSGTSLDGLDIAIVDFFIKSNQIVYELKHFITMSYSDELTTQLFQLMDPLVPLNHVSSMNMYLGELYAKYIKDALVDSEISYDSIDLISSHGQTIWHEPTVLTQREYARPNTMQIGDISVLAEHSGIPVIGDFRTRDMAAGGQGAPLVPFADQILFQSQANGRVLVNIGGISNMSVLPPVHFPQEVIAYDTGPGNMIIDAFVKKYSNGLQSYDTNGDLAKDGLVHNEWLANLLKNDYFLLPAPKSTGRELFGSNCSDKLWLQGDEFGCSAVDKIATITMLTAKSLATEIKKYIQSHDLKEVFVSGGGVHNKTLLAYLAELLPAQIDVKTSDEIGISGDAKEAFVFALLGYLGFQKTPNNLPSATGAKKQTVLGKISW
jgi:anhydro-N-acetylmuramic acid kinase